MILKVSHNPPTRPMIVSHSGSPRPRNKFRTSLLPGSFSLSRGFGDLVEELGVALGGLHLVDEELESSTFHRMKDPAETPDELELLGGQQQLFLTGPGSGDVDRREDALVGHLAVELQLPVTGSLELLEDHLVHPGTGLDQSCSQDRQRPTMLDVASSSEELLRRIESRRVHTTGQDASGSRCR